MYGTSDSVGVHGNTTSGNGVLGQATVGIGVAGISTSGSGLYGESSSGVAVYGLSTGNYSGYFDGSAKVVTYLDIPESSAPADPPANTARIFVRDNASATELCVKIGSTIYVLAP